MFIYNYRIFDRYQQPVITFVIYGDDSPTWEPNQYSYGLWGCEVKIKFPTVKLLDYTDKKSWDELDKSNNPFAIVVKAHLYTKYTKHKPQQRYKIKWQLIRSLYERGYNKQEVLNLFHFIDWIMSLPKELTQQLNQQLADYEEEQKMRYVTTFERAYIEKGIQKGIQQGIEQGMQKGMQKGTTQTKREDILGVLQLRFPNVSLPPLIVQQVNSIDDTTLLKKLFNLSVLVESMAKFEQQLVELTNA